jgi:hypothetical protein
MAHSHHRRRALGPGHPRNAATRENLAAVRREAEGQAAP